MLGPGAPGLGLGSEALGPVLGLGSEARGPGPGTECRAGPGDMTPGPGPRSEFAFPKGLSNHRSSSGCFATVVLFLTRVAM